NAQITSRTKSFGNAGLIKFDVGQLLIDGEASCFKTFTGVEARVGDNFGSDDNKLGAPGAGGIVDIHADDIILRRGGVITASTFGRGDAGGMKINAGSVLIEGSDAHEFTGLF